LPSRGVVDLAGIRRQCAVSARGHVGAWHHLVSHLLGGYLAEADKPVVAAGPGARVALFGLALHGPPLRAALRELGDPLGRRFVGSHHTQLPGTTIDDLPRSRYSTCGQAKCRTVAIGSSRPARCCSKMESRLSPACPSLRNGLLATLADQFTPVMILRPFA